MDSMNDNGQMQGQQQPALDSSSSSSVHPHSTIHESVHETQQQHDDDRGTHVTYTSRAPSTIPLDPADYIGWTLQMQPMLKLFQLWDLVDPAGEIGAQSSSSSSSSSSVTATIGEAAAKILSKKRAEAHFILTSALRDAESRRVLLQVPDGDPRALWSALKRRFASMPKSTTAALFSQLLQLRQTQVESVQQFADRISLLRHRLTQVGRLVSDDDVITTLVNGVLSVYSIQVSSFYNSRENATFEHLVEIARGEEARLQLSAGGAKSSSSSSSNSSALGASTTSTHACHNCGSTEHFIAACPKLHRQGQGRRSNS